MWCQVTVVFAESSVPSDRGYRCQVTVDNSIHPKHLRTWQGYERGRATSRLVTGGGLLWSRIPEPSSSIRAAL
jgi:hypothetical protein